jgi:hypothetical protein
MTLTCAAALLAAEISKYAAGILAQAGLPPLQLL